MILTSKEELEKFSPQFKKFFLLAFTKEIIKHSITKEIVELSTVLKHEKKEKKNIIKKALKKIEEPKKSLPLLTKRRFIPKPLPKAPKVKGVQNQRLRIPEIKLPPRLQYLKPRATQFKIDLGKLNLPLNDPAVKVIESNGPNQNIIVRGRMGNKKTKIILDKQEIEEIVQKFSEASKIPAHEGVFKVVKGNLIFSAIVSEVVGSKFVIKKLPPPSIYTQIPRGRF